MTEKINNNQKFINELQILEKMRKNLLVSFMLLVLFFFVLLFLVNLSFKKDYYIYLYLYLFFSIIVIWISLLNWQESVNEYIYPYFCDFFENLEYKRKKVETSDLSKSITLRYDIVIADSLIFEDKINQTQIINLYLRKELQYSRALYKFKGILLKIDLNNSFKGCTIIQSVNNFNSLAVSLFNEIQMSEKDELFRVHTDLPESEAKIIIDPFLKIMKNFRLLDFFNISSITLNNGLIFVKIGTITNIFAPNIFIPVIKMTENSKWYKTISELRQLAEKIKNIKEIKQNTY